MSLPSDLIVVIRLRRCFEKRMAQSRLIRDCVVGFK